MSQGSEVSVVPPAVQRDGSVALCCIQLVTAAGSGGKMYDIVYMFITMAVYLQWNLAIPATLGTFKVAGLER